MSQAERLKKVINYLLESPKSFAIGLGLSSATTIYDVISGKRDITPALLKRIINTHTNLNPEWLLNGTGEMLTWQKGASHSELNESPTDYDAKKCRICIEKDKIIDEKNKTISHLEEIVTEQRKLIDQLTTLKTQNKI